MQITLIIVGAALFFAIENVANNIAKASKIQQELLEQLLQQTQSISTKLNEVDEWFLKKDKQTRKF